jgi:PAS domain S-box-containing protein
VTSLPPLPLRDDSLTKEIIAAADDAIVCADAQDVITLWNRGAAELYGYTAEETLGKTIDFIIPPAQQDADRALRARLRRGEHIEPSETKRARKDGGSVEVSVARSSLPGGGVAEIARDLTAQMAERAHFRHEIRTPLGAITGLAELIAMSSPLTPRQKEMAETLRQSADHLLSLLNADKAGQTGKAAAGSAANTVKAPQPLTRRVLLAEDYGPNLMVATAFLQELGYEYDTAKTGREAVDKAATGACGMIIMDIQMPDMDGMEATRAIRSREAESGASPVPIVAMTGHATRDDKLLCMKAGMNDCLSKPFRLAEMEAMLKRYLPL